MPPAHRPDAARHDAVERLGAALHASGLSRLPSRVFAALLADEDGRMTATEVGAELEVSAAAVSGAVRYLTQVQLVRRERERGSRRDVYVVLDDAWHDLLLQRDQLYEPILEALHSAIDDIGSATRAGARMQLSVEFLEFIQVEMEGVAQRWEEHKARLGARAHPRE